MEKYSAPRWYKGSHTQTILPGVISKLIRWPRVSYTREEWPTSDGDFIHVDWAGNKDARRLLVLFHGLEGDSKAHYARRLGARAIAEGWRFAVAHFRGCSGPPNLLARTYHSGDSVEIDWMLRKFNDAYPGAVYAVGVSLGGNALLKWLGEHGNEAARLVQRAVAVSAPFDLAASSAALERGWSRVYPWWLLPGLRRKSLAKLERYPGAYDAHCVRAAATLREFEDAVTAPLHGFDDVVDYWRRASALPWLEKIRVPTLVLNAINDPFLPEYVLRNLRRFGQLHEAVLLNTPDTGGHAGFPGCNQWLARRVLGFLSPAGEDRASAEIRLLPS